MKKEKVYYAVASNDGLGIYNDVNKMNRIYVCLCKFPDTEIRSCYSIKSAKKTAIDTYNRIQIREGALNAIFPEGRRLPMNYLFFRREIIRTNEGENKNATYG